MENTNSDVVEDFLSFSGGLFPDELDPAELASYFESATSKWSLDVVCRALADFELDRDELIEQKIRVVDE